MKIVEAREDDARAIVALVRHVYTRNGAEAILTDIKEWSKGRNNTFFVALEQRRVVGYIAVVQRTKTMREISALVAEDGRVKRGLAQRVRDCFRDFKGAALAVAPTYDTETQRVFYGVLGLRPTALVLGAFPDYKGIGQPDSGVLYSRLYGCSSPTQRLSVPAECESMTRTILNQFCELEFRVNGVESRAVLPARSLIRSGNCEIGSTQTVADSTEGQNNPNEHVCPKYDDVYNGWRVRVAMPHGREEMEALFAEEGAYCTGYWIQSLAQRPSIMAYFRDMPQAGLDVEKIQVIPEVRALKEFVVRQYVRR
jgi:N-acetylglutamate synthase-like GNAT family acetyltransferase